MGSKKIFKNAFILFFIKILTPIVSFFMLTYISKVLGSEFLGKYSIALVFLHIVQFIPLLGLQTYIIREIAKDKDLTSRFMTNASILGLIISFFIAVLVYMIAFILKYPVDLLNVFIIIGLSVFPNAIILVAESIIIGYEKMKFIGVFTGLENLIKVIVSIILIKSGYGLLSLIVVILFCRVFLMFVYFKVIKQLYGKIFSKIDFRFVKKMLKIAPVFLGTIMISCCINRIDFILLSKLSTFKQIGFYTIAYRIFEICMMLSSAFILAVFPVMSQLVNDSIEKFMELTYNSIKIIFILTFFTALNVFIFSNDIIHILFSNKYNESVLVLQILVFSIVIVAIDQVLTSVLVSKNEQHYDLKVICAGLIVYLCLLLILIPYFGIYGAAIATFLSLLIQLCFRYYIVTVKIVRLYLFSVIIKPLVAGLITCIIGYYSYKFFPILTIVILPVCYVGLLIMFKVIDNTEIVVLKQLLRRTK